MVESFVEYIYVCMPIKRGLEFINIVGARWRNEDNDLLGCRARVGMYSLKVLWFLMHMLVFSLYPNFQASL